MSLNCHTSMNKMEWIRVKDELPKIPKGKYAVSVITAVHDSIYDELSPGNGTHVDNMIWDGKDFLTLGIGNCEPHYDFYPTWDPVTHWMYEPEPPKGG